jgi:sensor domain CHASE-containing protein
MHLTTLLLLLPLLAAEIAAKLIVDNDAFTHEEQEAVKHALARVEAHL